MSTRTAMNTASENSVAEKNGATGVTGASGAAGNSGAAGKKSAGKTVQRKAPLAVRILLLLFGVLMLVIAGIGAVNDSALSTYNQATATLASNLETAASDSPDLNTLATSQTQVDMQFESAAAMDAVLIPQLRSSIDHNADISAKLTELIADAQQQNADSSSDAANADGSSSSSTSALTDEQKQQIEDLLKANGKQNTGSSTPTDSATSTSQNTAKPW